MSSELTNFTTINDTSTTLGTLPPQVTPIFSTPNSYLKIYYLVGASALIIMTFALIRGFFFFKYQSSIRENVILEAKKSLECQRSLDNKMSLAKRINSTVEEKVRLPAE